MHVDPKDYELALTSMNTLCYYNEKYESEEVKFSQMWGAIHQKKTIPAWIVSQVNTRGDLSRRNGENYPRGWRLVGSL